MFLRFLCIAKIDTISGECPVKPVAPAGSIQNAFFFSPLQRHLIYARGLELRVIKRETIRGFDRKHTTILCDLGRGSSLDRYLPQLKGLASPVGIEIDPLPIARPIGSSVVRSRQSG